MNPQAPDFLLPTAPSTPFLAAVLNRRSIYTLTSTNPPIGPDRVRDLVAFALQHAPSPFHVQSARVVILLGDQMKRMWDIGDAQAKRTVPDQVYQFLHGRIEGFKKGVGAVLFFEDEEKLVALQSKNPAVAGVVPEWSDHSSGMHQFVVWTALELEGFGCNLQHYNYDPVFQKAVLDTWDLPATWKLKAQLNFGVPTGGPDRVKTFDPVEDRLKVFD